MHPMFDVVSLGFVRDTLSSIVRFSVLFPKLVECGKNQINKFLFA